MKFFELLPNQEQDPGSFYLTHLRDMCMNY